MKQLTDKQTRFCEEYVIDLNATQSAIRAGYAPNTANREGSRLLSNADIQETIRKMQAQKSESLKITAEGVLSRILAIVDNTEERTAYRLKGLEILAKHLCPTETRAKVDITNEPKGTPEEYAKAVAKKTDEILAKYHGIDEKAI